MTKKLILTTFSKGTIHKRHLLRGGGRGVAKLEFWGDFQGVFGEIRGGRVVKNHEKWGDVFYGWSLGMKTRFVSTKLHTSVKKSTCSDKS